MDPKTSSKKKKKGMFGTLVKLAALAGSAGVLYVYVAPHLGWHFKVKDLNRAPASLRLSIDKIRGAIGEAQELQAKIDKRKAAKSEKVRKSFSKAQEHEDDGKPGIASKLFETYGGALASAQRKVEEMQAYEYDNERLRLENANLRLWAEGLQLDCRVKEGAKHTKTVENGVLEQTGTRTGRTLASIHYRPPGHLLPGQLHTLGVSYFKGREDEKAAVILTFLTELEDNDSYKTPRDFVLAGVAWYRLQNLKLADEYFAKALKVPPSQPVLPYQAQARLWRGIVAERTGKHQKSQYWLRELVDHHPYATESRWVNSKNAPSHKAGETEEDELARRTLAAENEATSEVAEPVEAKHDAGHGEEKSHGDKDAHHEQNAH